MRPGNVLERIVRTVDPTAVVWRGSDFPPLGESFEERCTQARMVSDVQSAWLLLFLRISSCKFPEEGALNALLTERRHTIFAAFVPATQDRKPNSVCSWAMHSQPTLVESVTSVLAKSAMPQ